MALEESLRLVKQWMCGMCMSFHAKSRACHHPDGMVRVTDEMWEVRSHIMHIVKPSRKDSAAIAAKDGMVVDARLLEEVLQAPIFTVKSIPHSCRLAFSQTLKDALYQVVDDPGFVGPWVRLLLLPRCTLQVFKPQTRQDRRSGNRKSLQQRHILGCLAKWRETDGFAELVSGVLSESGQVGTGNGGGDFEEKDKKMGPNIKQCLRKVADGHFTAAVKVLLSSGVAPYNEDTMEILGVKHPYKPPPSMSTTLFFEAPLVVEVDTVLKYIKSFPKGTSCSRDGLRAQHLLDALCGEGSAVARDLLCAITLVVNLWLGGRCPLSLTEFVASAPLTPLLKLDGGICPIAVGTIWRCLVSKVSMKGVGKDMAKYLNDLQFGVGVSGGAEAIWHSVNRLLNL